MNTLVWECPRHRYRLHYQLHREPGGGYTATATRLFGVCSQGDTEDEAKLMLADAFRLAIEEYRASGKPIPWVDASEDGPTIIVDLEPRERGTG